MTKITVLDSIMGSGKTSYAIQHMNEAPILETFIFITPFLTEVERIIDGVTTRKFEQPNVYNGTNKLDDLKRLIASNRNIVSTHALFSKADDELIELIEHSNYTLILDESLDVMTSIAIRKSDILRLVKGGDISINEETKKVEWIGCPNERSRYTDVREFAQANNLYCFRDSFMVSAFNPKVFAAFNSTIVMTYLFEAQILSYYFKLNGLDYEIKSVASNNDRYEIVPHDVRREKREDVFALINLVENEKLNRIGDGKFALSQTKLKNSDIDVLKTIKNNLKNFFLNYTSEKVASKDCYFSTLKEIELTIAPTGFKKRIIAHNVRATNEFSNCKAIAYVLNRFMRKDLLAFFQDQGITVNENTFAISELLQWVYRSAIRNGESITLYCPSERMRDLLKAWSNYEI